MNRTIPALALLSLPLLLAACSQSPEEQFVDAVEAAHDEAVASAAAVVDERTEAVAACLAAGDCSTATTPGSSRPLRLGPDDLAGVDVAGTRLAALEGDFSGFDLPGAILSGLDLSGASNHYHAADLSGADLSGANLSHVDLSAANLAGANLAGANLFAADLAGADLSGATLTGTNIADADLTGAVGLITDSSAAGMTGVPSICVNGEPAPMSSSWDLAAGADVPVIVAGAVPIALAQKVGPCGTPTRQQVHDTGQQLLADCKAAQPDRIVMAPCMFDERGLAMAP